VTESPADADDSAAGLPPKFVEQVEDEHEGAGWLAGGVAWAVGRRDSETLTVRVQIEAGAKRGNWRRHRESRFGPGLRFRRREHIAGDGERRHHQPLLLRDF